MISKVHMSVERYQYYAKPGNIEDLILEIVDETSLTYEYVKRKIRNWMYLLPKKQLYVFQSYYYFQKSIMKIRYECGAKTNASIDRSLQAAIKKIKEIAKSIKL